MVFINKKLRLHLCQDTAPTSLFISLQQLPESVSCRIILKSHRFQRPDNFISFYIHIFTKCIQ